MRATLRSSVVATGCLLVLGAAWPAAADDGPTLYKQLCASCHDTGSARAPTRDVLQAMTPERVLTALESGAMLSMASGRTGVERRAIAEFVTGKTFAEPLSSKPSPQAMCRAASGEFANPLTGPMWNGWGANTQNTRYQDDAMAGLTAGQVPDLKLKWAFGFPGELSADGQPSIAGGRVFVGTQSGAVYALSASTGCVHWTFQADAAVRAAITIARLESGNRYVAFVGDRSANVYALDAASGALLWKSHVDDHPFARVTASPTYHNGRLYIGVASGEETAGAVAEYECCTFRGSLVVLDAATGSQAWKTYTIDEPRRQAKNRIGTQQWGPSGAPIWSSPTIDVQKNAVYVTTGNNYSGPASDRSDAFVAFDLTSGKILWSRQMTTSDDWNTSCRLTDQVNCTNKDAPDFDFASPPILVSLANGRRAVVAGQKSGVVHALDPDRDGQILWQERVGKGGINGGVQWGSAADGTNVYVALSDLGRIPRTQQSGDDPGSRRRWRDVRNAARYRPTRVGDAAATGLPHARPLQPRPVSCRQRDTRRRVLGCDRWAPSCLFHQQRLDSLGYRHSSDLQNSQRSARAWRLFERCRASDQRRHRDHQLGLRSERHAWQRAPGLHRRR